jgi:hypothetical protein
MAKKKLWSYLAASGALAIALSSVALGANMSVNGNSTGPGLPDSATATLPSQASSIASAVLGALTGGSNPSTVASQGTSNTTTATDNSNTTTATDETNETETDNDVSQGQESEQAGTTGTKPGWGCGDDNHTHSGPPGRPGATMPPGCSKSH